MLAERKLVLESDETILFVICLFLSSNERNMNEKKKQMVEQLQRFHAIYFIEF